MYELTCQCTNPFHHLARATPKNPRAFHSCPPCFVISYTRISRNQSHNKSGSLNKYLSTSQSTAQKSAAHGRTPSVTSSEPLPKRPEKPFRGHGRRCWPRPPWPPQRSAAPPRRHGRAEPRHAAPSGLGRRGCDAEGGAAAAAIEKQSVAMGCFSGWLGKKHVDRSYR